MNLNKIKHIHFTGIKGVGMTALACIACDFGIKVSGSDIGESFVTDDILIQKNIKTDQDFSEENIKKYSPDLVVYTAAHQGSNNIEVKTAKQNNISTLSFGEALGLFFNTKQGISVAGVGGKTSTSAMLATIFEHAERNPSYMIGVGQISSLDLPGKYDQAGDVFIAEADEYVCSPDNHKPKFYYQNPKIIIITNLSFDHPDVYLSKKETLNTFQEFCEKLPHDGKLIINGDSKMCVELIERLNASDQFQAEIFSYGDQEINDVQITNYEIKNQHAFFNIKANHSSYSILNTQYSILVPGIFNAKNAVGALIAAKSCGIPLETIQEGLLKFTGTKRRFEKIFPPLNISPLISRETGARYEQPGGLESKHFNTILYDDYAHHPDEIKATLKASRKWFPGKKIIVIFQPHTFSRTKSLLKEFTSSFAQADQALIMDIFPSAREPFDNSITSKMLVDRILNAKFRMPNKSNHSTIRPFDHSVIYTQSPKEVLLHLKSLNLQNTAIITMGAGDVYKLHSEIIQLISA